MSQNLTILGATGSIGLNTLDVVRHHPDKFQVFALTASSRAQEMAQLVIEFKPQFAVMDKPEAAQLLKQQLPSNHPTQVLTGPQALIDVAQAAEVHTVVAAIVGAAGLSPTMAAVSAGKRILLANKESLVMAGRLFIEAVKSSGACLLPVDSEHNAMFQCLPHSPCGVNTRSLKDLGVRKLLLTGSGGPFRLTPVTELKAVTPQQACAHPNWSMGPKISVDSATMMNKGLEFIEACWLFGANAEDIQVVVHPQSIVHSMVEYVDGSVLAQLGQPDMRTPIAHCLGWPERLENSVESLNFWQMGTLEFSAPDYDRFPLLKLAIEARRRGGAYPAALNAANEVGVDAFLNGHISFTDIAVIVDHVLQKTEGCEPQSLSEVIQADAAARTLASAWIEAIA